MMRTLRNSNLPYFIMMIATLLCGITVSSAQDKADAKQSIGKLKVSLIFGTDGAPQKGMKQVTGESRDLSKFC